MSGSVEFHRCFAPGCLPRRLGEGTRLRQSDRCGRSTIESSVTWEPVTELRVTDLRPDPPSFVLFDLDGTVIDSADGIIWSFEATLRDFGRTADRALLGTLIGPPLDDSFTRLGFAPDQLTEVLARYRNHYGREGVTRCHLYDGVVQLLDTIHSFGVPMAIATAKRVDFAQRIVDELGLGPYFPVVAGASLDGRLTSKDVIVSEAISKLPTGVTAGWMIGDRRFDILAARSFDLISIGVRWGYGTAEELRDAGATWMVDRPSDLGRLVVESFSGRDRIDEA